MLNTNGRKARGAALLTGAVVAASALFHPTPAQAADKEKAYKTGAIVLGAVGAYFLIKGKTLPGVLAGAGAYYAYKKSKDAKKGEQANYPDDDRYSRYPDNTDPGDYPDSTDSGDYPTDYPQDRYPDYGDYDYQAATPRGAAPARGKAPVGNSNSRIVLK